MNRFVSTAIDIGTTVQTENGDKTYSTSLDACLDLFFQIGAVRGQGPDRILTLFSAAYAQDPDIACRIALYARDIRGGQGERESFRTILQYLAKHYPDRAVRLMSRVPEVGRWDDLFSVVDISERLKKFAFQLYGDALHNKNGLAAKWAPREKSSKRKLAEEFMKFLGLSPRQYRKLLANNTNVVETPMCEGPKDDFSSWKKINYAHVPSVASARYSKAFNKRDGARYQEYLESVKRGEAKINTAAVYPYDVIKATVDDKTADVMWNNLPDYVKEGQGFLPMCDVSGSMTSPAGGARSRVTCLDVSISLGIYLAERNKSAFNRLILTFNGNPRLFQIPNGTIRQKVHAVRNSDREMAMNTNLDRAMELVLQTAIQGKVPKEEMPTHLLVLSDMEFDLGRSMGRPSTSVAERTKEMFEAAGYNLPNIVWWNLQSRHGNTPIRKDTPGMALVSGFSPSVMKSLLDSDMDPIKQMLEVVNVTRYDH